MGLKALSADVKNVFLSEYSSWPQVVECYTRCSLPFERNKLPAIYGVAQLSELHGRQSSANCRIIAGLREDNLLSDLIWRVLGKPGKRSHEYRAPSWPWTAINAKVKFRIRYRTGKDLTLITIGTLKQPLGGPGRWFIRLEGTLNFATLEYKGSESHWSCSVEFAGTTRYAYRVYLDAEISEPSDPIYYLPIKWSKGSGLILHRTGGENGEFRRLGLIGLSSSDKLSSSQL